MPDSRRVTLRHKADGTPYATIDFGRNRVTGKRDRRYREFPGMTDEQAQAAAEQWASGEWSGGTSMALGDQLLRYVDYQAAKLSEGTIRAYRDRYATRYVAPIARVRVDEVTPVMLDDLFVQLLEQGPTGRRGLAPSTVATFQGFLSGAFHSFARKGLIVGNPMDGATRLKQDSHEGTALDEESLRLVQRWIARELAVEPLGTNGIKRRNAVFGMYLALNSGMRVGEVCALRRCDVRSLQSTVSINGNVVAGNGGTKRQNKTKGHRTRNIILAKPVMDALRAHLRWQESYLVSHNGQTPICTSDGLYMRPSYLSGQFARMVRETGIDPAYTFHKLRHTHATWLLQSGVDFRTVQERLGHANPSTTLSIYAHVMPGRDAAAADTFQRALSEVGE